MCLTFEPTYHFKILWYLVSCILYHGNLVTPGNYFEEKNHGQLFSFGDSRIAYNAVQKRTWVLKPGVL